MNSELDQFSASLNKKHFDSAMQLKEVIKTDFNEEVPLKVHALDIYKKSFTFP